MPSSELILNGLSRISNVWIGVAVVWHLAVLVMLGAIYPEVRLSVRTAATLLALPLLTVVAGAAYAKLWFNVILFAALFGFLLFTARRLPAQRVHAPSRWTALFGVLGVLYGLLYPHFIEGQPLYTYAVAAPFGLVPCPTLAGLMGFTLLADGLGSRRWALTLGIAGLFYGIVGTAWLRVGLDVGLILLAALTIVFALGPMRIRQLNGYAAAATPPHGAG